jgi:hypothetical protein
MDDYLKQMIAEENKQLHKFLHYAKESINASMKHYIMDISVTELLKEGYDKVLEIAYFSGRKVYININANSIQATARELFDYIYNEKAFGFIKIIY